MCQIFTPAAQQTLEHRRRKNDLDINTLLSILLTHCQREYSFTWVSPNQYIIGLFQLFVGRLLNSSYPIFE